MREAALGAYAHQDLPFERLVEELQPERDLARKPLFQVMLRPPERAAAPPWSCRASPLEPLEVDPGTAKFDLALSLAESDGGFAAAIEYSADLFDAPTIARLAERLHPGARRRWRPSRNARRRAAAALRGRAAPDS